MGVTRSQTSTPTLGDSTNGTSSTLPTAAGSASSPTASNGDTSESLQYLKPATDEQTVAWSEGTRVTDLLF